VAAKVECFGWHAIEVDGHDVAGVMDALDAAEAETERPSFIVASTKKGRGVSFMELDHAWHGKAPKPEELERALKEIDEKLVTSIED
jgi:transketolase